MAQMKAGQAVIEALRVEGVEYTFGKVYSQFLHWLRV